MLIAALAQAPVIGGKVVKVNDAKARAVKGVVNVVQIPDGVAVPTGSHREKGRDALEIGVGQRPGREPGQPRK